MMHNVDKEYELLCEDCAKRGIKGNDGDALEVLQIDSVPPLN